MAASKPRAAKAGKAAPQVAPAGSHAPSAVAATPQGKSIFIFADGTGNSSAKLFKTNVWRMYEAVDFGIASPGTTAQVGYYDNGVGTSNFRPLALLGGIFGIGLKSNVLRLYTFLCRNYQPGDRIYAFGFSRGAFTIRVLVGMVASQGILQPDSEAALSYQVHDAYRAFRRDFQPNRWVGRQLVAAGRALRDGILAVKRRITGRLPYGRTSRIDAEIEFVGVWDTVAAYGGPFAEFTRGIDDWLFPLTMPDYALSPKVKKARHALSLDDERDAFWPLLWDEVREQRMIAAGTVAKDRMKQVWFAGVHSDVGGGYPDESLSYIPLLWMMDELGPAVDFLPAFVERAQDLANPYGPIHDSRSGPGAYYRYQPRKIAAYMDPPTVATRSLRPPETDPRVGEHGLLRSVCVHESVVARIISGIDNYAPAALPAKFDIVSATGPNAAPALTAAQHALLSAAASNAPRRFGLQENAWDLVWKRRLLYFGTVAATVVLVLLPWLPGLDSVEQLCSDDRCFAHSVLDVSLFFVPFRESLHPWADKPLLVMLLAAGIFLLITFGRRMERRFRDSVKTIWRNYLQGALPPLDGASDLRKTRESAPYQTAFYWLKWRVLPAASGFVTLVAILYAATIVLTQIMLAAAEPRSTFCKPAGQPRADKSFDTKESCKDLAYDVTKGQPYRLTLTPNAAAAGESSPWKDGNDPNGMPADPRSGVTRARAYMVLAAPLKRVTSANWMQVLTEVRAKEPGTWAQRLTEPLLGPPIDIRKHKLERLEDGRYETVFCARWDGRLYLMVNDAAPLLYRGFYENNHGTAEVSVAPALDKRCVH